LDKSVSKLIEGIYQGATDPGRWAQTVDGIISRFGLHFLMVACVDTRDSTLSRSNIYGEMGIRTERAIDHYHTEIFGRDPTIRFCLEQPTVRNCDVFDIFGGRYLGEDDYYRWSRDELGSQYWHLSFCEPRDGLSFGASFHVADADRTLSKAQRQEASLLFDHMENAMRLAALPPNYAGNSDPYVLIDDTGKVRAVSSSAEAILRAGDGLKLSENRLCATNQSSNAELGQAIDQARRALANGTAAKLVRVKRPSGERDLTLIISPDPFPSTPFDRFRCAVHVRITDFTVTQSSSTLWREVFKFTSAEVRLVHGIMTTDENLREMADRFGISHSTARVQLASIFAKTGVNSQSQLVRLLSQMR
jgi:PAS domain-containing protein